MVQPYLRGLPALLLELHQRAKPMSTIPGLKSEQEWYVLYAKGWEIDILKNAANTLQVLSEKANIGEK